jgi:tRNA/tmRNA/rRNA uracil-C5-methylase (TrmA/RlmC/RlmD family)
MIDDGLFDPKAANHDLYGGVGLFAAAMADRFGSTTRMTVVESDEVATEYAAENLSEWVGARALSSRVDRYLAQVVKNITTLEHSRWKQATVIVDPPRQGAGKETIDHLAVLAPAQIVYVACDPVALARDVSYLAEAGYELGDIRAFDLFPNTHHMEAVAQFVRAT